MKIILFILMIPVLWWLDRKINKSSRISHNPVDRSWKGFFQGKRGEK